MKYINRILTDADREVFAPIIQEMYEKSSITCRKISSALVQQAFVIDTIRKHVPTGAHILSVGDFEDCASDVLKYTYDVFGIDPVINYDVHTFRSIHKEPFDAIISTSVLEHTVNDEEFIEDCCYYLKSGGIAVLTVDFKNDYVFGDKLPSTSNRFYTTGDLTGRLIEVLLRNNCRLFGEIDYSSQDSFSWEGIFYSFATFCFIKE